MKRILIIRPSAIGDIVMASPMIGVLREAFPSAHIAWLAEPHVADLLRHDPDLDEVILWPKGQWRKFLRERRFPSFFREIRRFRDELRYRQFDLALDAVGLFKSRFLAFLSGAPERIGFESGEPGKWLLTRSVPKGGDIRQMSSEYRFLMESLGLEPGRFLPRITVTPEEEGKAAEILRESGVEGSFILFAPFTTRPQKHWFEDRWGDLALKIRERFALPVVVPGAPSDGEGGRRLKALAGEALVNLTGRTTLGQTAALVGKCTLLIGVDTGLTHMGTAFERPTIALFGATCPYLETPNPLTRVLYDPRSCSPCKRNPSCGGDFPCMREITVERVLEITEELLSRGEGKP